MKNRTLTCIVCPRGCTLEVTLTEEGAISSVSGNACKRGQSYAEQECIHPERTVTTTVRTLDGSVVPVKTAAAIPKEKVFEAMKEINQIRAKNTLKVGEVIAENIAGTGVSLVATANKA